jgi:hypothetical protein
MFGIEGAAIASFLSMAAFNLIKFIYIKINLQLNPFSWVIFKILSLALFTYWIQFHIFNSLDINNSILDLIMRSLLIIIVYILGIYILDLLPKEAKNWFKKIRFGS